MAEGSAQAGPCAAMGMAMSDMTRSAPATDGAAQSFRPTLTDGSGCITEIRIGIQLS